MDFLLYELYELMLIGIDGSRAFLNQRTGIEEYSYQIIKHLRDELKGHRAVLYLRKNQKVDFELPESWEIKKIKWPRFWTQAGLSIEMLLNPVNILLIPAHTVPMIHPRNTLVTVHGLEYEFVPEAYSFWERLYMRFVIKNSCRWAKKIIAVSNNTKKDLMNLYKIPKEKIEVIYEGYNNKSKIRNPKSETDSKFPAAAGPRQGGGKILNSKFLLFIGRLEERKNIVGIIKAFEILKERYKIPHQLVMAGKFGYGEEKIRKEIGNVNCAHDIILAGFVSDEEKWELLRGADVFLFPTFYEGFGLPVLEAQASGVPVVAGNNSSVPEITNCHSGLASPALAVDPESSQKKLDYSLDSRFRENDNCSAILVDPKNAEDIADAAYRLISDQELRNDIIGKGFENVKRFSWEKCAAAVADIIQIRD